MPNASDELHDGIVTHTVNLLRVAAGQRKQVLTMLEALENKLVADLNTTVGKTEQTISRLQALLKQTQATIATAYKAIAENNGAALSKIAQMEAVKNANVINAALKVSLVSVGHTPEQLAAIAGKALVQGKYPAEWWAGQSKQLQDKFATAMREGMLKGEGVDKLAQRVRGTKAASYTDGIMLASKAQAEALVRTSVITTANQARIDSIMTQGDVVKGIQWVATLDNRTTPICRALDGKQWTIPELVPVGHDKAFPGPTAHWNCRSTQIPVTRSWADLAGPNSKLKTTDGIEGNYQEILEQKMADAGIAPPVVDQAVAAAKVKLDGNGTSGTVTFEEWLKNKPDEFVDQVLGPGKAKLWRDGSLTISQMTDQNNRPLSLADLQELVAKNTAVPAPKEGEGGLSIQERHLLEQSMAYGVKNQKVLTHYVDADTGETLSLEGTGLTAEQLAKLQGIKRLQVLQNTLNTGEVWTEQQLGMFGKLQGFEKATLVGPTGRPMSIAVKPGKVFNQDNAAAVWTNFQALKSVSSIPQTQQKFSSAAGKEGTLKTTLGKADTVKLPAGTYNEQFAPLVKVEPFHDPVAAQAAKEAEAAAVKAKAEAAAAAEALAVQKRAAQAQLQADAYQARAEATDALVTADKAQAAKELADLELATKNNAAQQEIGATLADPSGKTLLAKAITKLMKDQPDLGPAELLEQAKADAVAAQAKASQAAALSGYKKKALAGEEPTPAQVKALNGLSSEASAAFLKAINEAKAVLAAEAAAAEAAKQAAIAAHQAKQAEEAAAAAEAKAAKKAAAAAKKAAKAVTGTPIPTTPQPTLPVAPVAEAQFPVSPSAVKVVKTLGGSTGAQLVTDPATGLQYVRKTGSSAGHVREEMTADRIYSLMGAPVPDGRLYDTAAGPVKMTAYLGDDTVTLQQFTASATAAQLADIRKELKRHFVLDALLGNWDVIGASGDNVLISGDLTPYRVDNGGSLRFKAMGALKPAADFGPKVTELETMLDPKVNPNAAPVFKGITEAEMAQQARQIQARRDDILATLPPELRDIVGKRIDYLVERFKVTVPSAEPVASALPAELPAAVKKSRVNGTSLLGDGGDVEDLHTLIWQEKDAAGNDVTRMQLKLTTAGSQKLINTIGEARLAKAPLEAGVTLTSSTGAAAISNVHPQDHYWPSLLAAAKTVSTHAGDGKYTPQTIATFNTTVSTLGALAKDKALDEQGKKMVQQYLDYAAKIQEAMAAKKALPAGAFKQFVYVPPAVPTTPAPAPVTSALEVYRTAKTYTAKEIVNGFATETTSVAGSAEQGGGRAPAYKFKIGDDVEVRWIRPSGSIDSQEALALQGQVEVTVRQGASIESIQKAHDALLALGIDLTPPSPEVRELVYLRRGIYLLEKKNVPAFDAILDGPETPLERVRLAKEYIKKTYRVALPDRPTGSYNPDGKAMTSFGDGHRVWERWDMPAAEVEKTMKGYVLTHHFSRSIPEAIEGILNTGGELTPTTQRLRKGVSLGATGGMSSSTDIMTGGASYFFTRIRTEGSAGGGLRLKIRNLSRLDAISYASDYFGSISRVGDRKTSPTEWKQVSKNSSNETIFKNGMSLLDEIDTIKTSGPSERKLVIDVFLKHGITVLPDGRKIVDVVL